ncbi:helix-turn-helix domain-containing protein [Actinomadura bangladeshensis]|jgi:transcriptional regulator with XRE-family HTH domain|uniref:Helix-turn-helix transcriptional regulator n=1 Tax=Actinomadura bangladeshensis TaxID=453573 RepID=A0A6L9QC71_9ACTN|nr:helix-turn-helix transcriptional regulator [Actinomadura bangladeshensis]NEA22855.1 helix-turn-helix transcriptional regulator [Actinomadura bangladeshensis]
MAGEHSRLVVTDEDRQSEEYQAARYAYELGKAVRERRLELGLTQVELARRSGMTQSQLSRLEAGGAEPTIRVLDRLARALDASLSVKLVPRAA